MKKEKKSRTGKEMLLIVLLLVIGFAAVTTTLVINGTIKIGFNQEDFEKNLKFTDAKLEFSDTAKTAVTTGLIAEDGKSITFTVDKLTTIGETATLTYEISNLSQYDADLQEIACTVKNADDVDVTNAVVTAKTGDYIKLESSSVAGTLESKTGVKADNTLTTTMIKSYVGTEASDTTSYTITCNIVAEPKSASATTTSAAAGA